MCKDGYVCVCVCVFVGDGQNCLEHKTKPCTDDSSISLHICLSMETHDYSLCHALPLFQVYDRLLITSWGHDPGVVPTSNVLTMLNDALTHSAVLIQVGRESCTPSLDCIRYGP